MYCFVAVKLLDIFLLFNSLLFINQYNFKMCNNLILYQSPFLFLNHRFRIKEGFKTNKKS